MSIIMTKRKRRDCFLTVYFLEVYPMGALTCSVVACSRLSDSGEGAKEKGARKAEWGGPPLLSPVSPRFFFFFLVCAFSIPRTRLSRCLEQASSVAKRSRIIVVAYRRHGWSTRLDIVNEGPQYFFQDPRGNALLGHEGHRDHFSVIFPQLGICCVHAKQAKKSLAPCVCLINQSSFVYFCALVVSRFFSREIVAWSNEMRKLFVTLA